MALDASARQYLAALTDQVHALGRDEEPRLARQRLTRARDQYRDVYAEARMRLPERVLDLVAGLGHDLGPVYGMVRRLDDGVPRAGDSPEAVRESIDELWGRLRRARRGIRTEPGVHGADPGR
ncbi:hypothetical protein [Streptomyces sp. WELS2]|uniref:hypothetical protein n=1 Tax=Streptomyces sp. WELS2 TaxID=2749435 RepID=UPI00215D76FF|nr:hypothetical protein [Streptomyces sp. WELS2]